MLRLTEQGEIYAAGIMEPLLRFEKEAVRRMGKGGLSRKNSLQKRGCCNTINT